MAGRRDVSRGSYVRWHLRISQREAVAEMRTYHIQNLPKGMIGRKIQKDGKEAYRIRINSREARRLRRSKVELIRP
jgi:hypothetical protein